MPMSTAPRSAFANRVAVWRDKGCSGSRGSCGVSGALRLRAAAESTGMTTMSTMTGIAGPTISKNPTTNAMHSDEASSTSAKRPPSPDSSSIQHKNSTAEPVPVMTALRPSTSMPTGVVGSENGVSTLPALIMMADPSTIERLPLTRSRRTMTETNSMVTTMATSDMIRLTYSEPRTSDEKPYGTML